MYTYIYIYIYIYTYIYVYISRYNLQFIHHPLLPGGIYELALLHIRAYFFERVAHREFLCDQLPLDHGLLHVHDAKALVPRRQRPTTRSSSTRLRNAGSVRQQPSGMSDRRTLEAFLHRFGPHYDDSETRSDAVQTARRSSEFNCGENLSQKYSGENLSQKYLVQRIQFIFIRLNFIYG